MSRASAAAAAHGAHVTLNLGHGALPQRAPDAPARRQRQGDARFSWR